jgi:branched-chain amino acid transport system permease protein
VKRFDLHPFLLHKSTRMSNLAVCCLAVFLVVFPLFTTDPHVLHLMILWLIWSIVATSWAVVLGFLGIFHFAQIAFFGLGAYASGLVTMDTGAPPWLGILLGGVAAAIMSLGLSLPALRLRGPYIAVVSFGFSECIRISTSNLEFTGAELGVWGVPPLWQGCGKVGYYYCILAVFAVVASFLYVLLTSRFGLAIRAMKQSQISSDSLGIQIFKIKITFFFISAFFAGVGGALFVHYMSGASPEIYNIAHMIDVMVMGLVGGLNSVFGPLVGAAVVFFSLENLRIIQDFRFMIYAVVMILIMMFKPDGIYSILYRLLGRVNRASLKS